MFSLGKTRRAGVLIGTLLLLGAVLTGCGHPRALTNGRPVEPLVPGEGTGEEQKVVGRFDIKRADVQIMDLSVTADGLLAAVGSATRTVYLLERGGKLRWERQLDSLPLQTYLEPAGRFLAVGTAGGQFMIFNPDQTIRQEQNFGHPVGLLAFSADGEAALAGLLPEDSNKADKLVVMNKYGRRKWEREFEKLWEARFAGPANNLFLSWQEQGSNYLAVFDVEGQELWRVADRNLPSVSEDGRWLAMASGQQVYLYNSGGEKEWSYDTAGTVRSLTLSDNGFYLSALVCDEATNKQELVVIGLGGERLWSKRLPDESDLLVSQDGGHVVVATWRQYRDDATQITVYNQRGREISTLEVVGKAQHLALQSDTLVLGLEDGGIFFLSIEQTTPVDLVGQGEKQDWRHFYRPVEFKREKDESLLTLFFYDQDAQVLIPVTRRGRANRSELQVSIEELIRGPLQGSYLQRTIPKEAKINVTLRGGTATIDLPATLDEMGGRPFLSGVLQSLLLTVSQFPTIEEIRFTVAGSEKDAFGQDGLPIDQALAPLDFQKPKNGRTIFLPYLSGKRYYLLPVVREFSAMTERALAEAIVQQILREAPGFLPERLALRDILFQGGATIYLDFNEQFSLLVASEPVAAARAALVRDAIALSLAENLPYNHIRFLAGSEQIRVPTGFPALKRTVSRPYYINLEE